MPTDKKKDYYFFFFARVCSSKFFKFQVPIGPPFFELGFLLSCLYPNLFLFNCLHEVENPEKVGVLVFFFFFNKKAVGY